MGGIPQVIHHHGNSGRFTLDSIQLGVSIATDSHERNMSNVRIAFRNLRVVICDATRLLKTEAVNDFARNLEPNQHKARLAWNTR